MKRMVYQFNLEVKAGIKLISEYCRLRPYLMSRIDTEKDKYALKFDLMIRARTADAWEI